MKKIVLMLAGMTALLATSPASAQCDNANCTTAVQEAMDPGYQAAARSGYSYGYGYVPAFPLVGAIASLFGGNSHKPANGELRTLADGTTVSYDKRSNTWLVVHQPAAQPRGVYSDRDVYAAR